MPESHSRVYGIDLGTTYSCLAYVDELTGQPVVVPNAEGDPTTPSVVLFEDGGKIIVGRQAKANSSLRPARVVEMIKRQTANPEWLFTVDNQSYRPAEVSAFILRKVAGDAQNRLKQPVRDAVITCPAWFGPAEREATVEAGKRADLNVREVIAEPVAAAIAYGMDKVDRQVVLVYDLGGGTFDATMIDLHGRRVAELGTQGDHQLGGRDWDNTLFVHLASEYRDRTDDDTLLDDEEATQSLLLLAEQVKQRLSEKESTDAVVRGANHEATITVTRALFEELTNPLLERTISLCRELIADAGVRGHRRLDRILLVGGSTRMPRVAQRLKEEFGRPVESFDPDEAIAKGAALYAWKVSLDGEVTKEVARETGQAPAKVELASVPAPVVVQAEQVVAQGIAGGLGLSVTAVKQSVRKGRALDLRPLAVKTFGIMARAGDGRRVVSNLILRGREVPAEETRTYSTIREKQPIVVLRLMENLSDEKCSEVEESKEIGRVTLRLPPGLRNRTPIEVTVRLTNQGRLELKAREPISGQAIEHALQTLGGLSTLEEGQEADEEER